jgi:putative photosynthetic complex assembly protein 2
LGDSPNQTGWWTYLVLWVMRQSAKLNVFLGVRNLNEEILPPHLKYLQTYFTQRPMNLLFPFSVTISTVAALWLWQAVGQADMSTHEAAALVFAATMLSLAVLEHWLLVVPMPSQALWSWGFASREKDRNESPPATLRSGAVAHSSASSLPQ